ncbi:MAG: hypothetical protein ACQKBV_05710 [Puniceicoccales bacterium]
MASWIDSLEKRFGRYAIQNLTFWIMVCQIAVYGFGLFTTFPVEALSLYPGEVLKGQVWRVVTFLFDPPMRHISVFIILAWCIFYMFGSTLEKEWGEFRYNMFILIGVIFTVLAGFLSLLLLPTNLWTVYQVTNLYLMTSVTIAFAILFPNFQIMIFFILPVKMKWVAIFILAMWGLSAGTNLLSWLLIFGALGNVAVFFAKQLLQGQQARQRRSQFQRERKAEQAEAFHTCVICGKTDNDDPDMEFAYKDGQGYCRDHWAEMDK